MGNTSAPTIIGRIATGSGTLTISTCTLNSSYATSGDTIAGGVSGLGLNSLDEMLCQIHNSGQIVKWSRSKTAPKLIVYGYEPTTDTAAQIALTEEASASDFSSLTV